MISIDITQTLKDTENALRDFVASELKNSLGENWILNCGVIEDRISKWRERKVEEEKRHFSGTTEERILYYADFYDLKTILEKNWEKVFSKVFSSKKITILYLDILGGYRDPDAHRRELLPHQKNLIFGIAGEIRSSIIRYRSKKETDNDCFPRIESVRDSLGSIWTIESEQIKSLFNTKKILHPGDIIDFVITTSDPEDLQLEFGLSVNFKPPTPEIIWQKNNTFSVKIGKEHISRQFQIDFYIKSPREYHASISTDDDASFYYKVLPNKRS